MKSNQTPFKSVENLETLESLPQSQTKKNTFAEFNKPVQPRKKTFKFNSVKVDPTQ